MDSINKIYRLEIKKINLIIILNKGKGKITTSNGN